MTLSFALPRVLTAAAWLLVAACTPSQPTAAPELQPIAYKREDGRVTTELTLDPALRAHPALRARLYDDGMTAVREFEAEVRDARTEQGANSATT